MSTPTPTGRLVPTDTGHDLILARTLPWPVHDVWAGITEPELTARWFGRWEGTGSVGETVRLQLGFEDDSPWTVLRILECNEPRLIRVLSIDDSGSWDISLELTASDGGTELRFVMHDIDPAAVGEIGPGWKYYLDQLMAALAWEPLPSFDDYFPAQREYFESQAR